MKAGQRCISILPQNMESLAGIIDQKGKRPGSYRFRFLNFVSIRRWVGAAKPGWQKLLRRWNCWPAQCLQSVDYGIETRWTLSTPGQLRWARHRPSTKVVINRQRRGLFPGWRLLLAMPAAAPAPALPPRQEWLLSLKESSFSLPITSFHLSLMPSVF